MTFVCFLGSSYIPPPSGNFPQQSGGSQGSFGQQPPQQQYGAPQQGGFSGGFGGGSGSGGYPSGQQQPSQSYGGKIRSKFELKPSFTECIEFRRKKKMEILR